MQLKDNNDNFSYKVREVWLENHGEKIYGQLYMPKTDLSGECPLVIYSHELACNHTYGIPYAKRFADLGFATLVFDFRGGGPFVKSEGKTSDMSVITQCDDLLSVTRQAMEWPFVDRNRIFLMGASQGGMVAALAAAKEPELYAKLLLNYPGFQIPDWIHDAFPSKPINDFSFDYQGWITLGAAYIKDFWDYDIWGQIGNYKKPVLIIHGEKDQMVPIAYSRRAAKVYPDCTFYPMKDMGHIFTGKNVDIVFGKIKGFVL